MTHMNRDGEFDSAPVASAQRAMFVRARTQSSGGMIVDGPGHVAVVWS